jgi:hypothetical protein
MGKIIYSMLLIMITFSARSQGESTLFTATEPERSCFSCLQFLATSDFIDAALNSLHSFQSLLKKENYRIKVTSFNNPTSNELGFSLETEINAALKPMLAKAKLVNPSRFSDVVNSLLQVHSKVPLAKSVTTGLNPAFSSLLGLVGNLAVQEKKITRNDIDSFILITSRYFLQYQKLNSANAAFDQNIERLNSKLSELQFDIKEFMLDLVLVIHPQAERSKLRQVQLESLYLQYLERSKFLGYMDSAGTTFIRFPSDALKNSKDIAYSLQKMFTEYQKVYEENYQQIRNILVDSRSLGRNVNLKTIEASIKELGELYLESRQADAMSLRLNTLFERLKSMVQSDPGLHAKARSGL